MEAAFWIPPSHLRLLSPLLSTPLLEHTTQQVLDSFLQCVLFLPHPHTTYSPMISPTMTTRSSSTPGSTSTTHLTGCWHPTTTSSTTHLSTEDQHLTLKHTISSPSTKCSPRLQGPPLPIIRHRRSPRRPPHPAFLIIFPSCTLSYRTTLSNRLALLNRLTLITRLVLLNRLALITRLALLNRLASISRLTLLSRSTFPNPLTFPNRPTLPKLPSHLPRPQPPAAARWSFPSGGLEDRTRGPPAQATLT